MRKLNDLAKCLGILGVALFMDGCSAVDNVTRSQPSTGFSSALVKNPQTPNSGVISKYKMVLYAIEFDGKTLHPVPEDERLGSELFLTVDVSELLKSGFDKIPGDDEKNIIRFLIYVSDHNATLWMTRIYALNKARHALVGGLKDLTTAGSGLSAFISPPAAASLGAASLLIGGTSNEIDEYIYTGKTIEALFKGIEAARAVQFKAIDDQLKKPSADLETQYNIYTALGDVKQYDSLVSFRKGLEYLAMLADATTNGAQSGTTSPPAAGKSTTAVTITPPVPPRD